MLELRIVAEKTPMMRQYESLKAEHPGCVLLFRMGDFYECFLDDARLVSRVLGITLTARGKDENRTAMAGIPYHALAQYLPKLIRAGHKVAIAEQTEEPQSGKLVERKVVKVITAGTVMDENTLAEDDNNHIASVISIKGRSGISWGLAYADVSTGAFFAGEFAGMHRLPEALMHELFRVRPSEVLIHRDDERSQIVSERFPVTLLDEMYTCSHAEAERTLKEQFSVTSLKGFGIEQQTAGVIAAALLVKYMADTQKTRLEHLTSVRQIQHSEWMLLDQSTIRNLELVYPLRSDGRMDQTLYGILNHCLTPMGQRMLRQHILRPLISRDAIMERLDCVELFVGNAHLRTEVRSHLAEIPDLERVLGRIGTGGANARDLIYLATGLEHAASTARLLSAAKTPPGLKADTARLETLEKNVVSLIRRAVVEDPPVTVTEGNIIARGFSAELDTLKQAEREGKEFIRNLQKQEIENTGITSLKVKFNKVFGYYIEVSKSNLDKVPAHYVRKQTLVNAERFITDELKHWEEQVLGAEEKSAALEYRLFEELRAGVSAHIREIQEVGSEIARIDVASGLAEVAALNNYVKPDLREEGETVISGGRHPVVERFAGTDFIRNDTFFNDDERIHLITGPNMSGKSTYIRQVALIVLLAQTGSYVPADSAQVVIADRVFTRVGASDNLASGESTFMVEMNETANILNNATVRSLLILDEVGRGTSTYDGIAIARAIVEHLARIVPARTLFATHYHELTELESLESCIVNYNVQVREHNGTILFMRKIERGATDKSYGIHVAEIAGLPRSITERAYQLLSDLESQREKPADHPQQLSFGQLPSVSHIEDALRSIDTDSMTPLDALKTLHDLRSELE
ncbi:MAG: DNA mismatch repair protein MutS [candidate division WS6 bacterium OLB20]|uniref:DNA mismatch repair protein MutS n=1 Tax=candidate division WS6 bacterium OLB20 TaxID=1617426 RepID=A0A136M0L2_9BACT|nr:MAG: DNA mismatch repair protein MutS [candidate division WS6 bacterium OLB20]